MSKDSAIGHASVLCCDSKSQYERELLVCYMKSQAATYVRITWMEIWANLRRWLMHRKTKQPRFCTQAKQRGIVIPPKVSTRETACLNAKSFVAGMGEETRKVSNYFISSLKSNDEEIILTQRHTGILGSLGGLWHRSLPTRRAFVLVGGGSTHERSSRYESKLVFQS
jgi:hypothetical protein